VTKTDKPCNCENCKFREVVFSTLDESNINDICSFKEEKSYSRGEIIIREGEKITSFKYLKSGLVKLFRRTSAGEEQVITLARPLDFVSTIGIFSEEKYKYSVSALEDSVICCVEIGFIHDLFMKNGRFALGLLTRISAINDNIILQTLDIRQRNLAGRVAFVLLYLTREIYKSKIFEVPVSRQEIADYIGMSTANVIRTISDFKRDGLIKVIGKTIEVINLEKLEIISKRG
jgi:CRP/FNR family transcriptional regulator